MGKKTNISRWDAVSRLFKKWGAWLRGIRVSADSSPLSPYMNDIDFGVTVTNGSALKLSAFFAGIRLIAENIASLPKSVKKVDSYGSSTSDKAHAANKVLHHPNQYTNAITFWMTIVSWLKGWGNAYAIIKRDYRGVPVALYQVHPSNVEISMSKGRKWYKVTIADPDFKFLEGIYSDENMLHFMEMSLDGIVGVNTVIYNAMALGKSLAQEKFAGEFYRKGGNIKAVLETDGNLGDEAYSKFLQHFQAASNFETPLLEYGIKYKQLSVNPVAAQLVQSETMSIQDIARILNVPPHMIAELSHATFSNIEHQTIQFVQYSLRPVVRKIEVELESKLLFDSERDMVSIKFSLDGLLRGDTTARSAFYHNAILDGYMTRNEVRSLEGLEHAPGLDDFLVPLNVASIDEEGNIRENTAPRLTMSKYMSKEINVSYRSMTSEIRKVDEESRTITFVASDDTKDSAGTVLNQDKWDLRRFNSNGVIGYQHKVYGGWDDTDNPDNVIGKGVAYIEDKKLMVDITFEPADINPLADKIYKKIQFGSLRAVSVGFLPIGRGRFGEGEDSETYYFAGQELLEVSVVNIPANPNALKKSLEAETAYLEAERKRLMEEARQQEEPEVEETEQESAEARDADIDATIIMARAALLI